MSNDFKYHVRTQETRSYNLTTYSYGRGQGIKEIRGKSERRTIEKNVGFFAKIIKILLKLRNLRKMEEKI